MASSVTASSLSGYSRTRFSLRIPFRVPQSAFSKKGNFPPFFFLSFRREVFRAPFSRPVGVCHVLCPSHTLSVRVSGFPPRAVQCWVSTPQFYKGGELYRLRGLRIRPGGVRGRFSAQRGCKLPLPIRSGNSGFSAGLTTASELSPCGPSSRTSHPLLIR